MKESISFAFLCRRPGPRGPGCWCQRTARGGAPRDRV